VTLCENDFAQMKKKRFVLEQLVQITFAAKYEFCSGRSWMTRLVFVSVERGWQMRVAVSLAVDDPEGNGKIRFFFGVAARSKNAKEYFKVPPRLPWKRF
tara:strand:- start:172 stop:468 length:297 start_codon:yes stop_codon:yes gene_type:complete